MFTFRDLIFICFHISYFIFQLRMSSRAVWLQRRIVFNFACPRRTPESHINKLYKLFAMAVASLTMKNYKSNKLRIY